MKRENKDTVLADFPRDHIIYRFAERDINLAVEILEECGGEKIYFPRLESIRRKTRDRQITELRIMLKLPGDLAREFGLSRNRILKIIKKGLARRFPCGPT
ncbi:MAG: hypothetical protein HN472_16120 [Nitrospina sp.]|jgi:Mor family transcriptional regulator|nr:hypothetical protein [Nitrospina sp.]